jgi:hypothetical protein
MPRIRGGDIVRRLPNSGQLFYRRSGPGCFISICSTIQICSFMPSYLLRTPTRSDDSSGSAIEVVQVPGFPNECFETIASLSLANCDSEIEESHLDKYQCDERGLDLIRVQHDQP